MVSVDSINKLLLKLSREEQVYAVLASHPVEEGVFDKEELEIRVLDAADTIPNLARVLLAYRPVDKKEFNVLQGVIYEKTKIKEVVAVDKEKAYLTSHAKRVFIKNLENQQKDHPKALLHKLGEYIWKA